MKDDNGVGPAATVVDSSGAFNIFDSYAINGTGAVAFSATLDDDNLGVPAIYVGPNPKKNRVIRPGDKLDGGTVAGLNFCEEGLNDSGQLAFVAEIEDRNGDVRVAVYRASPTRLRGWVRSSTAPEASGRSWRSWGTGPGGLGGRGRVRRDRAGPEGTGRVWGTGRRAPGGVWRAGRVWWGPGGGPGGSGGPGGGSGGPGGGGPGGSGGPRRVAARVARREGRSAGGTGAGRNVGGTAAGRNVGGTAEGRSAGGTAEGRTASGRGLWPRPKESPSLAPRTSNTRREKDSSPSRFRSLNVSTLTKACLLPGRKDREPDTLS